MRKVLKILEKCLKVPEGGGRKNKYGMKRRIRGQEVPNDSHEEHS